jgi:chromate transporter
LIDDDSPPPAHARWSARRAWRFAIAGLAIWAAALFVIASIGGWHGTLAQMAWFFTKAALLTFGGAYAVLPYVNQAAVEQYQWLSAGQMIDGLALGETTPGPLIMVVAFVGFVAGWTQQLFGVDALFTAGAAAATVATFFTFLPSFLFILIGGPLVEATHGNLRFTAPLTAITAAVVGVILDLALFFARHVVWPGGLAQGFDWPAALLGAAAFVALVHFKIGVVTVIGTCGVAGLGVSWFLN